MCILYFVVAPRNFIIAKLSIRKPGSSSVLIISLYIIILLLLLALMKIRAYGSIIKLRGVTTKYKIYVFTMQTFKELINNDMCRHKGVKVIRYRSVDTMHFKRKQAEKVDCATFFTEWNSP